MSAAVILEVRSADFVEGRPPPLLLVVLIAVGVGDDAVQILIKVVPLSGFQKGQVHAVLLAAD